MEQDVNHEIGKFHTENHGANIALLEEETVAYRKEGGAYGVVFTNILSALEGYLRWRLRKLINNIK